MEDHNPPNIAQNMSIQSIACSCKLDAFTPNDIYRGSMFRVLFNQK